MDKKGFPAGNPSEDVERIRAWWLEEMQRSGLSGNVAVEHAAANGPAPRDGIGKQLFDSLVMKRAAIPETHAYHARLEGAPWPMHTMVTTSNNGMVVRVLYHVAFAQPVRELRVVRKLGWFGTKMEFSGEAAAACEGRKELRKLCGKALSFRYEPPLRGFHASKKQIELPEAWLALTSNPAAAAVCTAIHEESGFASKKYSLGLASVVATLQAFEALVQ
jgi:hypothetical protein